MNNQKDASFTFALAVLAQTGDSSLVNAGEHVSVPQRSGSKPLVIAMLFSALLFVLFLCGYLSPLFFHQQEVYDTTDPESHVAGANQKKRRSVRIFRDGTRSTARRAATYNPLAYDVDSTSEAVDHGHRIHSGGSYYLSRKQTLFKPLSEMSTWPSAEMPVVFPVQRSPSPPPPAYTQRAQDGFGLPLTRTLSAGTTDVHRSARTKKYLLAAPKFLLKKPTERLKISKPIPHPEAPLPGPRLSIESSPHGIRTTFVRPCTAPRSVTGSILRPPAIYLPSPSRAVGFNQRSACRCLSGFSARGFCMHAEARQAREAGRERDTLISQSSSGVGVAL